MANYEGRGHLAPAPLEVTLSRSEMLTIYGIALELDRYASRSDTWGKGLRNGVTIEGIGALTSTQRAIFAGKIGEYAVRELARRRKSISRRVPPIDTSVRVAGDGGVDLQILGLSLQVKTRQRAGVGNLVKREAECGRTIPLMGDAHCFCEWVPPAFAVRVLGWAWNANLEGLPTVPAIVGSHRNIEVPGRTLLPMFRLWAELESRKELLTA